MPETRHQMIVHHADRLHVRITNGGTDKFETISQQIPTQRVGNFRARRNFFHAFSPVDHRSAIDEPPQIGIEAAEFLAHFQERHRVLDGGVDFQPVANDAGIGQ